MGKKRTNTNKELFDEALVYIPGGVNSPFRTFDLVGGYPVFMSKGSGSKVFDTESREYIDYSLGWGSVISGHANPLIQKTIKNVARTGWCFGTPTKEETLFAKKINEFFPSMEQVRLVNSGSEAIMVAIRLARGYTKKDGLVLFGGCYHGQLNDTLVKMQDNELVFTSAGIPQDVIKTTYLAEYNNITSVENILKKRKNIAGVLIEPVPGNMGVVLPEENFLKHLQKLCKSYGVLLIFDEVISGFGIYGGAQSHYNVFPDITVLGKSLAGGLPVGAIGGSKEIMKNIAPLGNVYAAGTFSGNSMTVNAGLINMDLLNNKNAITKATNLSRGLCDSLKHFISENNLPVVINHVGQIFSFFFTSKESVRNEADVQKSNFKTFAKFYHYLLSKGIYFSPSGEDTCFVSIMHSKEDIDYTISVIKSFFSQHLKYSE